MQLVNYPANLPEVQDTTTAPFPYWIPVAILVAAISSAVLLGTNDTPSDDINWIQRLATNGDVGAELQLGLAYRDGRYNLPVDTTKGFYWIERAAKADNTYAEDTLAAMYANGTGTEKNPTLARQWWTKAMHDGSQTARLHLSEALIKDGEIQQAEALLRK